MPIKPPTGPYLNESAYNPSPDSNIDLSGSMETNPHYGLIGPAPASAPTPSPILPGLIPVGGNPPSGSTPPATGDDDFFTKFKKYRDTLYGPDSDTQKEKDRIIQAETERKAATQRRISAGFDVARRAAERETQQRKEGITAGLGMDQGLNWTSTGEAALSNEGERLVGVLGDIASREQEALAREDELGADRLNKSLSDLRTERRQADTEVMSLLNTITDNELAKRQEDRLAKGQVLTETNQKRDDSRAVLGSILDKFSGADLSSLPPEVQKSLSELEKSAGYPAGFVELGLASLKELKQVQALDIAQQKLDQNQARIEQQMLIATMNAMIAAVTRIPAGNTVNIPGLGNVGGLKTVGDGSGSALSTIRSSLGLKD